MTHPQCAGLLPSFNPRAPVVTARVTRSVRRTGGILPAAPAPARVRRDCAWLERRQPDDRGEPLGPWRDRGCPSSRVFASACSLLIAFTALACAADSTTTTAGGLEAPHGCSLPNTVSAAPRSVDDVLAITQALPPDASLACFLETLEHPLNLAATASFLSLQPSVGDRSPRMFLFFDPLFMSVVPAGSGQQRLEMTVLHAGYRSVKSEIIFPLNGPLEPDAPYRQIHAPSGSGTVCSSCHGLEEPFADTPGAFISNAFRPNPAERVSLEALQIETRKCNAQMEPERCAMLHALFDRPVVPYVFPEAMPLFSGRISGP